MSSKTFIIMMIITIIIGTISEHINCTTVFEIRDTKMNHSQFLSLKYVKYNGRDTCLDSNTDMYLMKER